MEELVVYLRKEYFRAVDLTDKSGHILEFKYMPKIRVIEFYLTDFGLRGKGYGTACMNEIVTELGKKGITLIYAPTGYDLAPLGYTGPAQYKELMAGFYEKTGFTTSGDGDLMMKILD